MHWKWAQNPVYTGGSTVEGGHAVTAVGWGTLGNTDYWILRNSWGADWADHGYAKLKRGVNLDGIECSTAASMWRWVIAGLRFAEALRSGTSRTKK